MGGGQSHAIDNRNHKENDEKICVIVAGGDRIQKNNIEVCKAVELLSERINKKIELQICGRKYYDKDIFSEYPHTTYLGMLPNEQFMEKLRNAHVFVLNSEVESFGLSAVDALRAGCNILISQNSGIRSILSLTEEDIIFDTHNPSEIADKIEKLISKNNCMRILDSVNFDHYSWKNVADRLYKICEAVYKGENYNLIR